MSETPDKKLFLEQGTEGDFKSVLQVWKPNHKLILSITKDGKVEPGPDLFMDEVAQAFLQECSVYVQNLERKLKIAIDALQEIGTLNNQDTYAAYAAGDALDRIGVGDGRITR